MGLTSHETVITCKLPPSKMFNAIVFNHVQLLTNAIPHVYKRVELVQGDGGVGTLRKVYFGEGILLEHMLERVDLIDEENLSYNATILEGNIEGIEKIVNEMKFEESEDGGTIFKKMSHCYNIGDYKLDQEQLIKSKETSVGVFQILEDYIIANPHICLK
ncbi:Major strawberry allergen Fra a 1-A [Euphorbia peplus]|nr:Major strawberry allergen Fra a 1-A [Euphorbia peplus]